VPSALIRSLTRAAEYFESLSPGPSGPPIDAPIIVRGGVYAAIEALATDNS
jgi:hypothetical protein